MNLKELRRVVREVAAYRGGVEKVMQTNKAAMGIRFTVWAGDDSPRVDLAMNCKTLTSESMLTETVAGTTFWFNLYALHGETEQRLSMNGVRRLVRKVYSCKPGLQSAIAKHEEVVGVSLWIKSTDSSIIIVLKVKAGSLKTRLPSGLLNEENTGALYTVVEEDDYDFFPGKQASPEPVETKVRERLGRKIRRLVPLFRRAQAWVDSAGSSVEHVSISLPEGVGVWVNPSHINISIEGDMDGVSYVIGNDENPYWDNTDDWVARVKQLSPVVRGLQRWLRDSERDIESVNLDPQKDGRMELTARTERPAFPFSGEVDGIAYAISFVSEYESRDVLNGVEFEFFARPEKEAQ